MQTIKTIAADKYFLVGRYYWLCLRRITSLLRTVTKNNRR